MKLEGAEGDKAPSVRKNKGRKSGKRLAGGKGLSSSSFMGNESVGQCHCGYSPRAHCGGGAQDLGALLARATPQPAPGAGAPTLSLSFCQAHRAPAPVGVPGFALPRFVAVCAATQVHGQRGRCTSGPPARSPARPRNRGRAGGPERRSEPASGPERRSEPATDGARPGVRGWMHTAGSSAMHTAGRRGPRCGAGGGQRGPARAARGQGCFRLPALSCHLARVGRRLGRRAGPLARGHRGGRPLQGRRGCLAQQACSHGRSTAVVLGRWRGRCREIRHQCREQTADRPTAGPDGPRPGEAVRGGGERPGQRACVQAAASAARRLPGRKRSVPGQALGLCRSAESSESADSVDSFGLLG